MYIFAIYSDIWARRFLYHLRILFKSFHGYYNGYDTRDKGSCDTDYFDNIGYCQWTLHDNHSFHHLIGRLYHTWERLNIRTGYVEAEPDDKTERNRISECFLKEGGEISGTDFSYISTSY